MDYVLNDYHDFPPDNLVSVNENEKTEKNLLVIDHDGHMKWSVLVHYREINFLCTMCST